MFEMRFQKDFYFRYEGEYRSLSDSLELGNNEASLEHNLAGAVAPIINRYW